MTSQFDDMGNFYEEFSVGNFRRHMEMPSVFNSLKNISGKSILDFGCGTGVYSRLLKQAGADTVYGFDVSEGMLQSAKDIEAKKPQGITYLSELTEQQEKKFDLVLSVYVMPYATTQNALDQMALDMAKALKPGGRLLTLPLNPDCATHPDYYSHYGFRLFPKKGDGRQDADKYTLDLQGDLITAIWWSHSALKDSLTRAGFEQPRIQPHIVTDEGLAADGADYWEAYLSTPHATILDCRLAH